MLSPFMNNVRKCYVNQANGIEREIICDAVINSASSNVDPNLLIELNRLTNLNL